MLLSVLPSLSPKSWMILEPSGSKEIFPWQRVLRGICQEKGAAALASQDMFQKP